MSERIHDHALLDALERCEAEAFEGQVFRISRNRRDPLAGGYTGRWNNGHLALYTSLEKDTAEAEVRYHLNLQPVFPSKITWNMCTLGVAADRTLKLLDYGLLTTLDVCTDLHASSDYTKVKQKVYPSTQAVAAAAAFLEFDGMLVPSARNPEGTNLVLFLSESSQGPRLSVIVSENLEIA